MNTPYQQITNPLAHQMAASHRYPIIGCLGAMQQYALGMRTTPPDELYKRFIGPSPLGRLVQLNPEILK